jgi:hypothetical protein
MPESESHKKAKRQAPGTPEVPIKGGQRLDSRSPQTATEIERNPGEQSLEKAARRLKNSGAPRKVLVVPQANMDKAAEAMRKVGTSGTVKNLSGTKRRSVRK